MKTIIFLMLMAFSTVWGYELQPQGTEENCLAITTDEARVKETFSNAPTQDSQESEAVQN